MKSLREEYTLRRCLIISLIIILPFVAFFMESQIIKIMSAISLVVVIFGVFNGWNKMDKSKLVHIFEIALAVLLSLYYIKLIFGL